MGFIWIGRDRQRHRVVFNGILEAPLGFQVSGVYLLRLGPAFRHDLRRRSPSPVNRRRETAFARTTTPQGAAGTSRCAQRLGRRANPSCVDIAAPEALGSSDAPASTA